MHTVSPPLIQSSLQHKKRIVQMKDVATIILGGGQGSRLFPLTMSRCKPALCYGGKYRLIDIPISNAIHSGCQQIFVITQFLSRSLHQHILVTYRFGSSSTFIELLSTEEKPKNKVWFQGTADAVRQNLDYFEDTHAEYFIILSGDQLYHMDFNALLECARETDADMVIASLPVDETCAKRMGIMKINENHFIEDFHEKPQKQEELSRLAFSSTHENASDLYLGSMGIYLFKRKALIDILKRDPREDFGKHLIPTLVEEGRVAAYIHHGYWEDIGTVESFYTVNMALTKTVPPFDCYRESWPIYSRPTTLPGAKVLGGVVDQSILSEGTVIENATITGSVIGPRTYIQSGATIRHTYVMGNDFFTPPANARLPQKLCIGKNSIIERAIIDKHVCIGKDVKLVNKQNLISYDSDHIYIRDGIIIVPHGITIPDGFVL